jgi:prepilin peptidase CpaA
METIIWRSFIIAFAIATAYADLRWRKIPRNLTLVALLAGLAVNWHFGHLLDSLFAALIAFGISMGLFSLGAIGGGDVKLMTALAAMLRLQPWGKAMEIAIFAACAMALAQMVRHGAVLRTLRNMKELLKWFFVAGPRPHPELNVRNAAMLRSPFAVAVAMGTLFVVLRS